MSKVNSRSAFTQTININISYFLVEENGIPSVDALRLRNTGVAGTATERTPVGTDSFVAGLGKVCD